MNEHTKPSDDEKVSGPMTLGNAVLGKPECVDAIVSTYRNETDGLWELTLFMYGESVYVHGIRQTEYDALRAVVLNR
jgi:capsid portal protein